MDGRALLVLQLLLWATPASASIQPEPLEAVSWSPVVLPCRAPIGSDMENLVLEWTRPDMDQTYVFLFRDGRPFLHYQHKEFKGRVELNDSTLSSGDLSIKVHEVQSSDSGRYECHVSSPSHARKRSVYGTQPIRTIDLRVKESVEAVSWSPVVLPCRAPIGSDMENLVLEWTRPDMDQTYVFLFRDGRPFLHYQHEEFEGRVELNDPTLSSGDLSIKVLKVQPSDSGLYECHVSSQSHARKRSVYGTQPITTIDLRVKEPVTIVAHPGQDVHLTLDKQDFNVTSLMWKRADDVDHYVFLQGMGHPHHEHPQYKGRTDLLAPGPSGALSVVLRSVQPEDAGTYHCRIVQSQRRIKRHVGLLEPDGVVILKVPSGRSFTSGAPGLEGGAVLVVALFVANFLKIME